MNLVVTGIGVVSAAGIGRDAFLRAIARPLAGEGGLRVPEFGLESFLDDARSFRRASNATKFALAAISLALADAGPVGRGKDKGRSGLVIGVTHGAMSFSTLFHKGLLQERLQGASPVHFSESVLNAAAGNAAIAFGIRGAVHTLIGEETVGMQAMAVAASLLRRGAVDRCIVAGVEEWDGLVEHAYRQVDRARRLGGVAEAPPPLGEGAAARVLESRSTAEARGASPTAAVGPVAFRRCSAEAMTADVETLVRAAMRKGGLGPGEIGHGVVPTGRNRESAKTGAILALGERGPRLRWIDISGHVGNPFGAAGLMQAAASVALLSSGAVEGAGLILSCGIERTVSVLVLEPEQR